MPFIKKPAQWAGLRADFSSLKGINQQLLNHQQLQEFPA